MTPCDDALPPAVEPPPDLHTLLGQLTALRHEVNLQTKAVRAQQEQNAATLGELAEALDTLRDSSSQDVPETATAAEEAQRPLLKALVELHDALALAGREIGRVRESVLPLLGRVLPNAEPVREVEFQPPPPVNLPRWWYWLGGTSPDEAWRDAVEQYLATRRKRETDAHDLRARRAAEGLEQVRQALNSLHTGYGMSVQRVERALQQHGLEAIPTTGQPFDPERMEVVEAVAGQRPAGRRGGRGGPPRLPVERPRLPLRPGARGPPVNGTLLEKQHGNHRRHRPGHDQQRGRHRPRRPAARLRGGRRPDPALVRRPVRGRPAARRQGGAATSGCWPRSAPSSRSSARWART